MDDRWERIQDLFIDAASLPPAKRHVFLDAACGADTGLRAEVESLLEAEEGAGSFVESAIGRAASTLAAGTESAPRTVGAYRILREIGRGGMGAVYLAERADQQYHKRVAIKLARFAGYGDFVHERFRHERQILASLEHQNIARLLDGGETEDGMPYIVMEYVEGLPVTGYIEQQALGIRARLELFLKIAAAVQYAHRFLVIHRDLKPSNILVSAAGEPKLLDFGIAKLLEPGALNEAIMHTSTGMRLLTPDYASPEQVRGEPVTTASDVYSLGVVLYEMLTGVKPHRIKDYTPLEIDRAVCETETERPSAAAARTGTFHHLERRAGCHRSRGHAQGSGAPLRFRGTPGRRHPPLPHRAPDPGPAGLARLPRSQVPPASPGRECRGRSPGPHARRRRRCHVVAGLRGPPAGPPRRDALPPGAATR
ncbi:MAG: protein kinase [Paludibaculum sp.]